VSPRTEPNGGCLSARHGRCQPKYPPGGSCLDTDALEGLRTPIGTRGVRENGGKAMADDPVKVASNNYKVLFENERVRLLEVREGPGEATPLHGHPAYLVYGLSTGQVRLSSPTGESAEVEVSAGDVMWREPEEHSTENIGSTELRALFFELK